MNGMICILQDREERRECRSSRGKELRLNSACSIGKESIPQEKIQDDMSDIDEPVFAPILNNRRPSRENQFLKGSDSPASGAKSITSPKTIPEAATASSDSADRLFAIAFDTETHDFSTKAGHSLQGRVIQLGWVEYTRSGDFKCIS
jgi:hypothetical protein